MRLNEIGYYKEPAKSPVPYDPVEFKQIESLLKGPFSEAWGAHIKGHSLWKGYDKAPPAVAKTSMGTLIADSTLGTRRSKNTRNFYTLLIDNSPAFKVWPKRSKSFIVSTSRTMAMNYMMGPAGITFLVLPINGTKIAVVNDFDIWDIKIFINDTDQIRLRRLNDYFSDMGATDKDYDHFLQSIDQLPKDKEEDFKLDHGISPTNFLRVVQSQITPKTLGFTMTTIDRIPRESTEAWFSGKALFMTHGTAQKLAHTA